jgi:branched-chain amino acid aminotransferase
MPMLPVNIRRLVLADTVIGTVVRCCSAPVGTAAFLAGLAPDGVNPPPPGATPGAGGGSGAAAEPRILYEVVRVQGGGVMYAAEHMDRLRATLLGCTDGDTARQLADAAHRDVAAVAAAHDHMEHNIKLLCWRRADAAPAAAGQDTVAAFDSCAYYVRASYPPAALYAEGVRFAVLHDAQRDDPHAKAVQRALRERAVALQADAGAYEVLLCHADGLVPEGSRSNYFLVDAAGTVRMSRDEDVLLGVTRMAVLAVCAAAGIPVAKEALRIDDVMGAAAVAMTGTSVGVMPVADIDGTAFASATNPTVLRVMELYAAAAYRQPPPLSPDTS